MLGYVIIEARALFVGRGFLGKTLPRSKRLKARDTGWDHCRRVAMNGLAAI